ncbi:MAG: Dethiobiotin synthetase [Massilibacillus sp.]|nr:Dethiobiotin synthetase [Massilibacillus sp.]
MHGLFITATDTDIGKTMITGAIAAALKERGIHVGVFKPLASGAICNSEGNLVSEDASFLMKAAGIPETLRSEVNAVSRESGIKIDIEDIIDDVKKNAEKYDMVLIEGVGGITAPLWQNYLLADMMKAFALPAVIVSKPRLGAINHTVLTYEYAKQRGIELNGVILNRWEADSAGVLEESNIEYIEAMTGLPIVGKFPLTKHIDVNKNCTYNLAEVAEKNIKIDQILEIIGG